jgi:tetratricopeptide (TPR) repeat protein
VLAGNDTDKAAASRHAAALPLALRSTPRALTPVAPSTHFLFVFLVPRRLLFCRTAGGSYPGAIDLYTQAIGLNPNVAAYYANRAFAYIRMELYGSAIVDANKSIELDKNYLKASLQERSRPTVEGRKRVPASCLIGLTVFPCCFL